jgi:hypothetical protein
MTSKQQQSKVATYGFALVVAFFLGIFSFDWKFQLTGGEMDVAIAPKDPPPIGLLVPGLTLIGLALGINIDGSTLVELLQRGK